MSAFEWYNFGPTSQVSENGITKNSFEFMHIPMASNEIFDFWTFGAKNKLFWIESWLYDPHKPQNPDLNIYSSPVVDEHETWRELHTAIRDGKFCYFFSSKPNRHHSTGRKNLLTMLCSYCIKFSMIQGMKMISDDYLYLEPISMLRMRKEILHCY